MEYIKRIPKGSIFTRYLHWKHEIEEEKNKRIREKEKNAGTNCPVARLVYWVLLKFHTK